MLKIVVAHQKGGVGKSMITKSMAMECPRSAIADVDPQGTTRRWIMNRREAGKKYPGGTFGRVAQLPEMIAKAEERNFRYMFIDTPPDHADERAIRAAIEHADAVVIPTKMSDDDLAVLAKTVKICNEMGKPWVVVLNMAKRSRSLQRAVKYIDAMVAKFTEEGHRGAFCKHLVYDRMEHVDAIHLYATAGEIGGPNSKAAEDITKMTKWVMGWIRKEVKNLEVVKNGEA